MNLFSISNPDWFVVKFEVAVFVWGFGLVFETLSHYLARTGSESLSRPNGPDFTPILQVSVLEMLGLDICTNYKADSSK